jgi:predicted nucleotidyltransferase
MTNQLVSSCVAKRHFPDLVQDALVALQARADLKNLLGVIVFGSHATGQANSQSDLDCIVISDYVVRREYHQQDCLAIDLIISTELHIRKAIQKKSKSNNNFYVDALANGIVVVNRSPVICALVSECRQLYSAGPPSMSAAQAALALEELQAVLRAAKGARLDDHDLSAEQRLLTRIRLDQVVRRAITTKLRLERQWSSTLPQNIQSLRGLQCPLLGYWENYVASQRDDIACARIAAAMVDVVARDISVHFPNLL